MAANPERFYWDSSIFICFLSAAEQERRRICEHILGHAEQGNVEIITSMYTLVEVIRPKGIRHPVPLTDEQAHKLEGMFKWPFLKKIQVHEELAFRAARLARSHGLKPADAIHAATAISEQVDELQAWDSDYGKVAQLVKVAAPDYLHNRGPLFASIPIGPTPADFTASTGTAQPSEQSLGAAKPSGSQPAHSLLVDPQAAPKPPQPGSSPAVPPRPPSKK